MSINQLEAEVKLGVTVFILLPVTHQLRFSREPKEPSTYHECDRSAIRGERKDTPGLLLLSQLNQDPTERMKIME